jgi:hypothetical protein
VLPAEHLLGLAHLDLAGERLERLGELRLRRLPLARPLDQDPEILDAPAKRFAQLAVFLQPPAALQQLLGGRLVFPEIGRGEARLDLRQLLARTCGVKDSSADPRRASRDPGTA